MIKAVFFDLDNTLVDFMRMKKEAVKAAVAAMLDAGHEMSYKDTYMSIMKIYDQEGIEYQTVFDHFLKAHYGTINHKMLAASVVAYRRSRDATLVLYPHVTATLMKLVKLGIKLAVISDAPVKQVWLRLFYLNLHNYFDTVIATEETGEPKPSPLPFHLAMERLKIDPTEALMLGDWPERDIAGANNVGIKTVFARYGAVHDLDRSGATYEIEDISEIIGIVSGLNN